MRLVCLGAKALKQLPIQEAAFFGRQNLIHHALSRLDTIIAGVAQGYTLARIANTLTSAASFAKTTAPGHDRERRLPHGTEQRAYRPPASHRERPGASTSYITTWNHGIVSTACSRLAPTRHDGRPTRLRAPSMLAPPPCRSSGRPMQHKAQCS